MRLLLAVALCFHLCSRSLAIDESSFYSLNAEDIRGEQVPLSIYQGKVIQPLQCIKLCI